MIIVAGALRVRPEDRNGYLAGCRPVVAQARAAPGCLDFSIGPDLLDDGRITVLERWRTRAELEAFRGGGPTEEQAVAVLGADVADYDVADDDVADDDVADDDVADDDVLHGGRPLPPPTSIGAPAGAALLRQGIRDLRDLTRIPERELLSWHGVGPKAASRLRKAMAEHGLEFAG